MRAPTPSTALLVLLVAVMTVVMLGLAVLRLADMAGLA